MAPRNFPKNIDAQLAGKRGSKSCSLLLTEGDSAALFVEAGLPFVEVGKFGVCPLKGMLVNVRDNPAAARINPEVLKFKSMLGLIDRKVYTDVKDLRYGRLVLMTDQDNPGHHIKGLILNMIECLWPSLLRIKGFIQMFVTPLITANHKLTKEQKAFCTLSEFDEWQSQSGNEATNYNISYHKGLATFSRTEAKQFFLEFEEHLWNFEWINENDNKAIKRAFGDPARKRAWLLEDHQAGTSFYPKGENVRYRDFINNEVRQGLLDAVQRAIPSIVDGFKPSQRKVIYCALENSEIQGSDVAVEQFSALVAKEAFYLHGEKNLHGVIVRLAQDFVGSNNINFLLPNGQFGSRIHGRKINADGRYVRTKLSPVVPYICHSDDKLILDYLFAGGKYIEPSRLYPIIAMMLVNGAVGVAPGWKTFIPHYNPRDIIDNIRRLLEDQEVVPLCAWYKGFTGDVIPTASGYVTQGKFSEEKNGIKIKELPVGTWKNDYETTLKRLQREKVFKDFTAHHPDTNDVHYEVTMTPAQMRKAKQHEGGLLDKFQLTTKLCTANMYLIEENGVIKKFGTPDEILKRFFDIRLECYERRRIALLCKLMTAILILENKIKYVSECYEDRVSVLGERNEKFDELRARRYDTLPSIEKKVADRVIGKQTETEQRERADLFPRTGYDYLLSMPVGLISRETLGKLQEELDITKKDFKVLDGTSPKQLWASDLDELTRQLDVLHL